MRSVEEIRWFWESVRVKSGARSPTRVPTWAVTGGRVGTGVCVGVGSMGVYVGVGGMGVWVAVGGTGVGVLVGRGVCVGDGVEVGGGVGVRVAVAVYVARKVHVGVGSVAVCSLGRSRCCSGTPGRWVGSTVVRSLGRSVESVGAVSDVCVGRGVGVREGVKVAVGAGVWVEVGVGSGVREGVGVGRGDGVGGVMVGSGVGVGCGVLVGGVVAVGAVCARGAGESAGVVSVLAVGWSAQANAAMAVPAAAQSKNIVGSHFIKCTLCSSGIINDTATQCGSKRLVGLVPFRLSWCGCLYGGVGHRARYSRLRRSLHN